ncbi:MAG: glycosyltransferase family 4 protein [Chloroflexi bacterium]|nr:glycosyltransferase family 4 protein [Chloroflexota bacterium]
MERQGPGQGTARPRALRVLILTQYFPPDAGGSCIRPFYVAKGLMQAGAEVRVVAGFPHYPLGHRPPGYRWRLFKREEYEGIPVLRVWMPPIPHRGAVRRLLLHLTFALSAHLGIPWAWRADVLWVSSPNLFFLLPALTFSLVGRCPMVRNVDDLWPEVFYELGLLRGPLLRRVGNALGWLSYRVPRALTPISPTYKDFISQKYRVPAHRIEVIEVGIDTARYYPMPRQGSKDTFTVIYSGALGVFYDFASLLEAARLLGNEPSIRFVIRGTGEMAEWIRREIERQGLANVELDTKLVTEEKLLEVLNSADAFVLPMVPSQAADSGIPAKVFQYQACGRPIICATSGAAATYVEATKSGLVVPSRNPGALAQAIRQLRDNPHLAQELGNNGHRHVAANLSCQQIGRRMLEVLERARGGSRGRTASAPSRPSGLS